MSATSGIPRYALRDLVRRRRAGVGDLGGGPSTAFPDARVTEVPSYERSRMHGRSNLNALSDGFRVLRTIAVEALRRRSRREEVVAENVIDLTEAMSDAKNGANAEGLEPMMLDHEEQRSQAASPSCNLRER